MFPTRLLFSENIVATLYPGPAAAAAPQRAASFWPQKPQLFVGSIHCGTWFCGFSEEWGMTERSGRDPGAGIRSARTGEILTAGNLELALWDVILDPISWKDAPNDVQRNENLFVTMMISKNI